MSSEQTGSTPGSGAVSDRMRALLSRAAEEQLLEQRQVSSVLGELRALVEDVDERLATGEQVEHVAAQVRAVAATVEARLDATDARSAELAERISQATAMAGQAAQGLVDAVAAAVADRVEAQLRELAASTTASVEAGERRLATHVDDAVLALAEVVLRRRSGQPAPAAAPPPPPPPPPPATSDDPSGGSATDGGTAALVDPATDGLVPVSDATPPVPDSAPPGDGFVLVPADVTEPDAGPAPPVQHERRTAERRASERSDGSGRRRRPWWRRA